MKLIKKDSCGVIMGKITRGILATAIIGTLTVSLSISFNTKKVKPHVKLADTNGQVIYCIDKNDQIFIKTIGYDVHSNSTVISDYLTGRVIAVVSKTAVEQYKVNNNLQHLSNEEFKRIYLSSLLREECLEIQSISSLIDETSEKIITELKLREIINNVNENPESYLKKEALKPKIKEKKHIRE